ncbi:MAG: hypothetical protein B7733_03735 [Myxococcales bacterium FL481]|nr:MAG: hypothetical protein B7733_03735 [Myxococcales bacterium FL481]
MTPTKTLALAGSTVAALLVAAAILTGPTAGIPERSDPPQSPSPGHSAEVDPAPAAAGHAGEPQAGDEAHPGKPSFHRPDRTKLRRLIHQAIAAHGVTPATPGSAEPASATGTDPVDSSLALPAPQAPPVPSKELQKQMIGNFFEQANPLMQDCYDSFARPGLQGVLAVGSDLIYDDQVGGVLDAIELQDHSSIVSEQEPEFVECIRQSMLSIEMDHVEGFGKLWLTLNIDFPLSEVATPADR